ncbi:HAP1 region, partial [Ostertagia ostertagi]
MSTEAIGATRATATTNATSTIDCIYEKLMQKDRDLEIAAKIGQSLLEQNRDLQQRTEFLEESLAKSSEEMVQMKHELDRKAELLRVYCRYDDDGFTRETTDDSLKKRLEKTKLENIKLRHDVFSMKKGNGGTNRTRSKSIRRGVTAIVSLHAQVVERGEDYAAQSVVVEKLLREISLKSSRERELTAENADLSRQVDEALHRQNELGMQMKELQDRYAELSCLFSDAEEELCRFRSAPPMRSGSVDSLYDSLASELENSDSGFSTTPAMSARAGQALSLRLELQRTSEMMEISSPSKEEFDVPSSVLAEVVRKKISIEPVAPPQTPLSEVAPTPETPRRRAELTRKLTCDVSTSCSELAGPSLSPLATSTPERSMVSNEGILQLSEPRSTCCTPITPPARMYPSFFSPHFRGSLRLPTRVTPLPRPLTKCPSDDSLDDYVAPKMGEPGVPGTRDLIVSLKMLRARRKVNLTLVSCERVFRCWCVRKV